MKHVKITVRTMIVIGVAVLLFAALPLASDDMLPMPDFNPPQGAVSDQELQAFGIALISIQEIQSEANEEIGEVIEQSELSEERLSEILQLQQVDPAAIGESVADDELREFEVTIGSIEDIHETAQDEMIEEVTQQGFEVEEFNQLSQQIQEDPELMNRLQGMFMN